MPDTINQIIKILIIYFLLFKVNQPLQNSLSTVNKQIILFNRLKNKYQLKIEHIIQQYQSIQMNNLEHDIQQTQMHLLQWLKQYEQASQQIIQLNHASKLHRLLETIAAFDHVKLKELQSTVQDQVSIKHIASIADRIRKSQEAEKEKPLKVKSQIKQRQPRIAQKPQTDNSSKNANSGFLRSMMQKFGSKEKVNQIILPDKEPDCYYDPVTRSYIFQGEEPEPPKVIPRPPSKSQIKKDEVKKEVSANQFDNLVAPVAYNKRKSTQSSGKTKIIKSQIAMVPEQTDEPMNYANVVYKINQEYAELIDKVKRGVYDRSAHVLKVESQQQLQEYICFSQRTLEYSQEISQFQSKVLDKWGKIIAGESKQFKLMQKVIKQLNDSSSLYFGVASKIDEYSIAIKSGENIKSNHSINNHHSQIKSRNSQKSKNNSSSYDPLIGKTKTQQREAARIDDLIKSMQHLKNQNYKIVNLNYELQNRNKLLTIELQHKNSNARILAQRFQSKHNQISQAISHGESSQIIMRKLANQINEKQQIIQKLSHQNEIYKTRQVQLQFSQEQLGKNSLEMIKNLQQKLQSKEEEFKQISKQQIYQQEIINNQMQELKQQNQELERQKIKLQQDLKFVQATLASSLQKASSQINKEKIKNQTQLKSYQQKSKIYAAGFKSMQSHDNLIHQLEEANYQENKLLNSILQKRLQLAKNPQHQQCISIYNQNQDLGSSPHPLILQLSQIINSITETHLQRMDTCTRNASNLHKKYNDAKKLVNKTKDIAATQNLSLNRSVTRLKSLIQTYKMAKEEAEQKCSQLQLECDKLKKKVDHFKEQDQFNKSYLFKIKSKQKNSLNQSIMSLQQNNEDLLQKLTDKQKDLQRKDQSLKKIQADLQDLLINYQNNQTRLIDLQKKYKQSDKELRGVKQERGQYANKIKLLQLKLQNQKEKNQQQLHRDDVKLKNIQANYQKKTKLLRNELEQAFKNQQELLSEINDLKEKLESKVRHLEEYHLSKEHELSLIAQEKEDENSQILILLEQTNQKQQAYSHKLDSLSWENSGLKKQIQGFNKVKEGLQKALTNKNQVIERKNQQLLQTANYNKLLKSENEEIQIKQSKINSVMKQMTEEHNKQIQSLRRVQRKLNQTIQELLLKSNSQISQQISSNLQYDNKMKVLKAEVATSNSKYQDLTAQLSNYSQLIREMEQYLAKAEDIKKKQQKQIKVAISKYQIENDRLNELLTILQDQLEIKKNQVADLEELVEQLDNNTSMNEQIRNELQRLKVQIGQKDEDIKSKQNQIVHKVQQMRRKDNQLERRAIEIVNLREQIAKQQQKISLQLKQICELNSQINSKDQLLSYKIQEITTISKQLLQREQVIHFSDKQVQEQQITITQQQQQINNLTADLQELANQINNKEGIVGPSDQLINQIGLLNNQIVLLKRNIEEKQKQFSSLQQNLLAINEQLQTKNSEFENLQIKYQQIKHLPQEIIAANQAISYWNTSNEEKQLSIKAANDMIKVKENQIIELQTKVGLMEEEIVVLLDRLESKQKEEVKKQEEKDGEVEGQMQYFLQQLDKQENDASKLKDKLIQQNKIIENAESIKQELLKDLQNLKDRVVVLQTENANYEEGQKQLIVQLAQLESDKNSLNELIEAMQKQVNQLKCREYNEIKQDDKIIADFVEQCRIKDQAYIQLQANLQSKELFISQITADINSKLSLVQHLQKVIEEKSKLITKYQIVDQEKDRILQMLRREIQQKQGTIHDLQTNMSEMGQIIETQEQQIQISKSRIIDSQSKKQINDLKNSIQAKNIQLNQLKKKLQEVNKIRVQTQSDYEQKIETLERQINNLNSLKVANRKLQDNYKNLQIEVVTLTNQKVQLMRNNDYLVDINQKLVAEKSPHSSKEHQKSPVTKSNEKPKQTNKEQRNQVSKKQVKQDKNQQKEQVKGFFGSLSSFFLTPTESDKMVRK